MPGDRRVSPASSSTGRSPLSMGNPGTLFEGPPLQAHRGQTYLHLACHLC
jgi:hypothetical protein